MFSEFHIFQRSSLLIGLCLTLFANHASFAGQDPAAFSAPNCQSRLNDIQKKPVLEIAQQQLQERRDTRRYIQRIVREQNEINAGKRDPQYVQRNFHAEALDFMISRLNQMLDNNSRTVYDGHRYLIEQIKTQRQLTPNSRKVIEALRDHLVILGKSKFVARYELTNDAIIFTTLYSSSKRVLDSLTASGNLEKQRDVVSLKAYLELQRLIDEGPATYPEVINFIKNTRPMRGFRGDTSLPILTTYPLTERDIIRLWGRGIRMLGLTDQLSYNDGSSYGFSPLEFLRHDSGHAYMLEEQISVSTKKVVLQYAEAVEHHLSLIGYSPQLRAQTAILFYLDHERGIPYVSLKAWARGQTVASVEASEAPILGDGTELAKQILKRNYPADMRLHLGSKEKSLEILEQEISNIKKMVLSWDFLPDKPYIPPPTT